VIKLYISHNKIHTGVRTNNLYALHIYIDDKPVWTTYITAEDYTTLLINGAQQI
jgi:hypothetical protein